MRHQLFGSLLWVGILVVSGCDAVTGPESAIAPGIETEGTSFIVSRIGERLVADIPYSFTNRTGSTVHIANCLGGFELQLQRLKASDWVSAWSPLLLLCAGPPIVIEAGEIFRDTLQVSGEPGLDNFPAFDAPDPPGTYRIVWGDAVSSYPSGSQIALEHRTSNSFRLWLN